MAVKVTVMPLDIDPNSKPITQVFDKQELTLGRLPSNDIVLNRPEVSGIHARIRIEANGSLATSKLYITDLGSSNGTMVEKNALSPRSESLMSTNERIFIGNFVIKPSLIDSEPQPINREDGILPHSDPTQEMRRSALEEAIGEEAKASSGHTRPPSDDEIESFARERLEGAHTLKSPFQAEEGVKGAEKRDFLHSLIGQGEVKGDGAIQEAKEDPIEKINQEPSRTDISPFAEQVSVSKNGNAASHSVSQNAQSAYAPKPEIAPKEYPINEEVTTSDVGGENIVDSQNKSSEGINNSSSELGINELSFRVVVDGNQPDAFNITAAAYSDISGKIVHKGKPLSGVTVASSELGSVITGVDGRYVFPQVLEGTQYNLQIRKPKFLFNPAQLSGEADIDNELAQIEATELFAIKGVISHKGKPLAGVVVDGGDLGQVTTGPEGQYVFENVPEGKEFDLKVSKAGFAFKR